MITAVDESRVVARLVTQLGGAFSDQQIAATVAEALHDLRGSVSAESLPEMGFQLARSRLQRAPDTVGTG